MQDPAPSSDAVRTEIQNATREAIREAMRDLARQQRGGREVISVPGGPVIVRPRDFGPPEGVVMMTVAFFVCITVTTIGVSLARAFGRRRVPAAAAPDMTTRLERIEQAVDAIAIEVERISEGQRFTSRVMSEMRALPPADVGAKDEIAAIERGAKAREAERAR